MKILSTSTRPINQTFASLLKTTSRFANVDVVFWWMLISLLAISFSVVHPITALSIGMVGGVIIGVLSIRKLPSKNGPIRDCAWLVWLEPVTVLVFAPFFLFPSPHRAGLFLFVLLIFALHFLARRRIAEPSPVNTPLMLILFMVLVSLWGTYDLAFSLPKIAGVLLGAAIYIAVMNSVSSPGSVALAIPACLLITVAFSALVSVGTQWSAKIPLLGSIAYHLPHWIRGVPGAEEGFYPNAVAGVLILFLPLQIALFASILQHEPKKIRMLWSLCATILVNGGVLVLTQSRGGWVGLIVGISILWTWQHRRGRWLAVPVILAGTAIVLKLGPERFGNFLMTSMGGTAGAGRTIEARLELWSRAIYGISDFPFTGMGMNTFRKVVHVLYPLFLTSPDVDIASCHNQLLQTALDLGIPGLVAYVALLAAAIAMGVRIWRHASQHWMRASAQGLVCGIVAQQVFGITDSIPLGAKVGIFFWIALGLLAAMYRQISITPSTSNS